jgi:hypothetical protein
MIINDEGDYATKNIMISVKMVIALWRQSIYT